MTWPLMPNTVGFWDRLALAQFVLTNNRLTNGPRVKQFEQEWNKWLCSSHSLMVSSGSTANFLLLASVKELYEIPTGAKVLLPACTWVTNVAPVMQLGLTPIFCDINLDNFSFEPAHLQVIAAQHPDIQIAFVTHLLGFAAPHDQIQQLWPHVIILDDVCESHGAQFDAQHKVGSQSVGATFSFYWGHHITTIEGGMISTQNADLYELMRLKRSHGMARESNRFSTYASEYPDINPQFLFVTDGYNFRSSEINAVLGLRQLNKLDHIVQTRRENYALFADLIRERPKWFIPLQVPEYNSSFCLPFLCHTPEQLTILKQKLTDAQIEHRPIVGGNLLRQPFLKHVSWGAPLPYAQARADVLNDCGCYIGNNHFVTPAHLHKLEAIMDQL
jgi:CDP-4-dehydro-6-deoxyglucose reductase, E1